MCMCSVLRAIVAPNGVIAEMAELGAGIVVKAERAGGSNITVT